MRKIYTKSFGLKIFKKNCLKSSKTIKELRSLNVFLYVASLIYFWFQDICKNIFVLEELKNKSLSVQDSGALRTTDGRL